MEPLVLVHRVTMMFAIQGGLGAEEILARRQSTGLWPAFYGLFVLAAAIHGGIGLHAVLR